MSEAVNSSPKVCYYDDSPPFVSAFASSADEIALDWECKSNKLALTLNFTSNRTRKSPDRYPYCPVFVEFKFDDEAFEDGFYLETDEHTYVAYFEEFRIPTFTQKALSSNQLIIRISDLVENRVIASTFKLTGLGEELKKLDCTKSYFK